MVKASFNHLPYKSSDSILQNNKTKIYLTFILLLFLCLVTHGGILTHQFMIDDYSFRSAGTIPALYHDLGDFLKKSHHQHFAPFYILLNGVLFRLFHNPLPLYLINLVLFYINCGLLFVFVYLISQEFMTALLTSIIFCIHPMTGDMLQHITFNIIFLQTIFIESGLIALCLYANHNRRFFYYFFSLFMVFLALFCHEIILLFPLYAAALLFFLMDLKFLKIVKLIIPYIFLSLLLIFLWLYFVNTGLHLVLHPKFYWTASANFSHVFFWYLSNLFVPRNIVFMCNMPPLKGSIWLWNILFFGFLIGCGLLIFGYLKKSLESFAIVLFLTGFVYAVPASLLWFVAVREWTFEPNWFYFSSVGFYLFIVLMLLNFKKYVNRFLFIILLSTLFLYYFIATLNLNIISKTEVSYCENWFRKFPGSIIPTYSLQIFYMNHKSIAIPSDFIFDMLYAVDTCIKYDYPQKALELIERISSSELSPVQRNALLFRLAAYHCKYGRHDQCGEFIHRIIDPTKDPYAYLQLSEELYNYSKDIKTATVLLKQCMTLYPKFKEPYLFMGVILANEGYYEESIYFWKQGMAIDPADLRFVSNIEKAIKMVHKRN